MRQQLLSEVLVSNRPSTLRPSRLIVCFSHLRWDFVYQRPQHLLTRAARGNRVYYVEEPIFERSGVLPRLDLRPQPSGVTVAVPVLQEGCAEDDVVETQRLLMDELLSGHAGDLTTFWYYTPMALAFTGHLAPDLCVYDCMDELSAFRGAPPRLTALERELFNRADIVFTGGQSLYEAKRDRHPNVHAFPSSIDAAHFGRARAAHLADAPDQAGLARPRLGFFGVIDERMDLGLVAKAADLRPDWQFVMLGPVVKIDPAALPRRANLHWLGGKRYDDLPTYLAHWDVGMMPFALNESTRFISPTKTPEFLAAGVPVVSTAITDVVRPYGELGLVEIVRTPAELVARAEAVMRRPRGPWLTKVDAYLAGISWDKTWAAMQGAMTRAQTRPDRPEPVPSLIASSSVKAGVLRV